MDDQSKNRVIGAFVVGFAIVAGAYTLSSFTKPTLSVPTESVATVAAAPTRVAIEVQDANDDGIEDWRETFITPSQTIRSNTSTTTPFVPETVTEQFGVNFFQDIVRMKGYDGIGRTEEQVLNDTIKNLTSLAKDTIIDVRSIVIGEDSSAQAVRTYANSHADIILTYGKTGTRPELEVLDELLKTASPEAAKELGVIANAYKNMSEQVQKLVVPPQLAKMHLDLINVYQALYIDISAMQGAITDPMVSLIRLQRYEDDADGLVYAMENMYQAVLPYASAFERNDSALLFVDYRGSN
ncbi:MAG: hypothetical protein UW75_C0003G0015 [Parcubacteria group bacterium GW2011_GWF2_44_8]|nr:MAG: hypothetical protein UW75_C0003G0015 [Parcubacteria group bacterium GW2011_GWF2_44_8]